jgi:hypothetical protein
VAKFAIYISVFETSGPEGAVKTLSKGSIRARQPPISAVAGHDQALANHVASAPDVSGRHGLGRTGAMSLVRLLGDVFLLSLHTVSTRGSLPNQGTGYGPGAIQPNMVPLIV